MNLLEVKSLSKTYGSGNTAVHALKNVSFSVPKGEFVAIVGESGSGKSTLLNMIGALDTPTEGKVYIDGKDILSMNDNAMTIFRRRNIGFIFQAFNLKLLTPEKIEFIAKKVAEECSKDPDNLTIRELKKSIREADQAIENLWRAIEQGQAVDMLSERLAKRQEEKKQLEETLAIEENKRINLTEPQVRAFLDFVREMPNDDINKRRAIINVFVHSIYLYDDHFTIIINASKKPLTVDNIPLEDIESALEGETGLEDGCSTMSTPVPPY